MNLQARKKAAKANYNKSQSKWDFKTFWICIKYKTTKMACL